MCDTNLSELSSNHKSIWGQYEISSIEMVCVSMTLANRFFYWWLERTILSQGVTD